MSTSSNDRRRGSQSVDIENALVDPERIDGRHGPRARNRALCCECGTARDVSVNYHREIPAGVKIDPLAKSVRWLRCSTCSQSTLHALLQDSLADVNAKRGGCWMERDNREQDEAKRHVGQFVQLLRERYGAEVDWVCGEDASFPVSIALDVNGPLRVHKIRIADDYPSTRVVKALERAVHHIVRKTKFERAMDYGLCGCTKAADCKWCEERR
ncbi:hypothetical protein ACFJIY_25025 [Pimelobacter simplex]|uniref:hypothetical protein n=1 Tax=Nocardioides simplex TaxID=2045 RepID=UPI00366D5791